jgi:hypothetical protein
MPETRHIQHRYRCPVCFEGRIEKEAWEMLYGKNLRLHTCGISPEHLMALKTWIGQQLDEIDSYGCDLCWHDDTGCNCKAQREAMKYKFLTELTRRMDEVG